MTGTPNQFVWYDVMTPDTPAAQAFYTKVVGWTAQPSGMGGPPYTLLLAGGAMIGGIMGPPPEAQGMPPRWTGYIHVDDVDAYADKVTAAGGTIHRAPDDIPQVGRFAVAADPYGAVFLLFKPLPTEGPTPTPAPMGTPGHVGWHELHAGDGAGAFEFYSGLFGWTKDTAIDMGPMGVYQLFAAGGPAIGGMMTRMPQTPASFWLYYFNVETLDAAIGRLEAAGGRVVHGPTEVPGGSWIVQGLDPQGAMFALVAPKR